MNASQSIGIVWESYEKIMSAFGIFNFQICDLESNSQYWTQYEKLVKYFWNLKSTKSAKISINSIFQLFIHCFSCKFLFFFLPLKMNKFQMENKTYWSLCSFSETWRWEISTKFSILAQGKHCEACILKQRFVNIFRNENFDYSSWVRLHSIYTIRQSGRIFFGATIPAGIWKEQENYWVNSLFICIQNSSPIIPALKTPSANLN